MATEADMKLAPLLPLSILKHKEESCSVTPLGRAASLLVFIANTETHDSVHCS